jgi:hypothetical protein
MDVSRYEVNRQVRSVLNKYSIDLTRVDYSCIGGTVYLSGELLKALEEDIAPAVIESLFKEISRLSGVRNVQSDLQNWNISAEGNSWQITKSKKKSLDIGVPVTSHGGTAEAAKDVHIETSEEIADVLKDMQEKPEQEDR